MPEEDVTPDNDNKKIKIIERQLLQADPKVFNGINPNKKKEILTAFTVVERSIEQSFHSGPIPSPDTLEKYNAIIPNGADRIMRMAEKQQDHRIELEKTSITEHLLQSKRGQVFGLIIGMAAIIAGSSCILMGHEWPGAVIGTGGITGLVSVFVYGKQQQKKSINNKNK